MFNSSDLALCSVHDTGLPMKITYFVGPYDLLDTQTRTSVPMTIECKWILWAVSSSLLRQFYVVNVGSLHGSVASIVT